MKKSIVTMPELFLNGISIRTNNQLEMNPNTKKIAKTVQQYFQERIAEKIKNRIKPGVTYAVYTDYDSNEKGDYTYLIGEAVENSNLATIIINAEKYVRFTTEAGKLPDVILRAWQSVWNMNEEQLSGKRAYRADFECYDERASDPNYAVVDIYIGIK